MVAAWPPVAAARFVTWLRLALGAVRLLGTLPEASPREPLEGDVGIGALELVKGRLQVGLVARSEGGRLVVDEDGPVREARWHLLVRPEGGHNVRRTSCPALAGPPYLFSKRFSFSTSVVRLRPRSRAASPLLPPVRSSDRWIRSRSIPAMNRSRFIPSS